MANVEVIKIEVIKIKIVNFKRIELLELDVEPITAIVGGNTSGKSSVLQAAQLGVSLLQSAFRGRNRKGDPKFVGSVSDDEVFFHPTHHLLDLRRGGAATERDGFEIGFTCTITEHDTTADTYSERPETVTIEVKRGKNANISIRLVGSRELAGLLAEGGISSSIFTPGLSGISTREELRTRGALASQAMQGDANTSLRSLVYHLFHDDADCTAAVEDAWDAADWDNDPIPSLPESKWKSFCTLLDEVYEGARLLVDHNEKTDQFIDIQVQYSGQLVPLDLASTGMLQVIQILAYACFFRPPLLLLDEPDSHLHADSQSKLFAALKGLTSTTNTRIVLASHSPQLIQEMNGQEGIHICWMEDGSKVILNGQKLPAIPLLMRLGALNLGAEAFNPTKTTILLTEDTKSELVRVFAEANGAQLENLAVLSYSGCENLGGARQLAILLKDLRPDVSIVIHRDRDFRTEPEMQFEAAQFLKWCDNQNVDGVSEIFTTFNDIEHKFASFEHIKCQFPDANDDAILACLTEAISEKRDDLVSSLDKAREVLQQKLYDTPRLRQKPEWTASGLPAHGRGQDGRSFRPASGTDPFSFDACHGKTIEKAVRQKVAAMIGGNFDAFISRLHSPSAALVDDRWHGQF
jgi:predicted ATPase